MNSENFFDVGMTYLFPIAVVYTLFCLFLIFREYWRKKTNS